MLPEAFHVPRESRAMHLVDLRIGDALEILQNDIDQKIMYDAIVTDPPYETSTYYMDWDASGVTFSPMLWQRLFQVLKPGGFIMAFSALRWYHRVAMVAELAGFAIFPYLTWEYGSGGMPKPQNVSTLFDRDNVHPDDRKPIGYKRRSGHAKALVHYGVQQYNSFMVPVYDTCISDEAKKWKGYYYGMNCFKPVMETIMLAQKPIVHKRTIDNIREFGTGALNLTTTDGLWPTTVFRYPKAKKSEHGSNHPTVKPLALIERLVEIACPAGGYILDPFAGTGTTGVAASQKGFRCSLVEMDAEMEPVILRRLGMGVNKYGDAARDAAVSGQEILDHTSRSAVGMEQDPVD